MLREKQLGVGKTPRPVQPVEGRGIPASGGKVIGRFAPIAWIRGTDW